MFSKKEKSVIYEAFDMYYADYCKRLPSNEELSYITFTKDFEERMKKLIERERKFYYYWTNTIGKRVAMIVISIIISLATLTFSVKAIREPVVHFIVETFEKFSSVVFANDKSENDIHIDDNLVLNVIKPNYIPKGYALESSFEQQTVFQSVYINSENNNTIVYSQYINDESVFQVNTEGIEYDDIFIGNYEGISYSNKGNNTVMFSTDDNIFMITSQINMEEIIKIAESINLK